MVEFNIDDEVVGYSFSDDCTVEGAITRLKEITKDQNSTDSNTEFAEKELNSLRLLHLVCGDHPFINNLIKYHMSLPPEKREIIINSLPWNNINSTKLINDFSKAIDKIKK